MKNQLRRTTVYIKCYNKKSHLRYFFTSSNLKNNNLELKPVVTYNNADIDKVSILGDNRKKIGIYR